MARLDQLRDDILEIQVGLAVSLLGVISSAEIRQDCVQPLWRSPLHLVEVPRPLCLRAGCQWLQMLTFFRSLILRDLVERYSVTTRDPHHLAVAKASLLELIIDRVLLLSFALVHHSRGSGSYVCMSVS